MTSPAPSQMSRGLSIYLDIVRFLAALEVFLSHAARFPFTGIRPSWWNAYGHEAVVLFFVLSGFLITYAATEREHTAGRFFVSRLSRIYSVALPALVLTLALDLVGRAAAPAIYAPFTAYDQIPVRLAISALLVNESWGLSVQTFSNTPYWSIAYELWYYFLFGSALFFTGRTRWGLLALFGLIAGPKVLLLFPIWLLGSWAYRETGSRAWHPGVRWAALLAVVPVTLLFSRCDVPGLGDALLIDVMGREAWRDLAWSRHVLTDTLFAVFVALHFVAAKHLAPSAGRLVAAVEPVARALSRFTFTLYLIHQPVMLLVGAMTVTAVPTAAMPMVVLGAVAVAVIAFGPLTEQQRHRLTGPLMRVAGARIDRMAGARRV